MDAEAFTAIFNQYYPAMCFYAERLVHDVSMAKSIAQEVFIALWEKRERTEEIRNPRVFLAVATRNRCLNYLSATKSRDKHEEQYSDIRNPTEESMLQHLIRSEVIRALSAAIERLPDHYRQVIQMTYQEGKSAKEIAKALQIPESTVRNQKQRGLKLLKKLTPDHLYQLLILLF